MQPQLLAVSIPTNPSKHKQKGTYQQVISKRGAKLQ